MRIKEEKRRIRIQEMTAIIQNCRSSGLSVKEWCRQNQVGEGAYYYWLKVIRNGILNGEQEKSNEIVQVALPEMHLSSKEVILIKYQGVSLEIPAGTTSSDIVSILRAVKEVW